MTTEAQVRANRLNAQKSTGPRTPEGKARVARNAVKHGFFAKEVVIKGEDPGEFEFYRGRLLEDLAPADAPESCLAGRIVDLAWQLRRAERLQGEAFVALYDQCTAGGRTSLGAMEEVLGGAGILPVNPNHGQDARATNAPIGETALGRMVLEDFTGVRVLERLLAYERRIESKLVRTMAELRQLRRQPKGTGHECIGRGDQSLAPTEGEPAAVSLSRKTNPDLVPSGLSQSCETNPIPAVREVKPRAMEPTRGTKPIPTSVTAEQLCGTKPISEGVRGASLSGWHGQTCVSMFASLRFRT